MVREKRWLDPWESFHVRGVYNYSELWFLTYVNEILALFFLIPLAWVVWKFKVEEWVRRKRKVWIKTLIFKPFVVSLASSFGIVLVWKICFTLFPTFFYSWVFVLLLGILFTLFLLLAPPIYFSIEEGAKEGMITFLLTLIFTTLIFWVALQLGFFRNYYSIKELVALP